MQDSGGSHDDHMSAPTSTLLTCCIPVIPCYTAPPYDTVLSDVGRSTSHDLPDPSHGHGSQVASHDCHMIQHSGWSTASHGTQMTPHAITTTRSNLLNLDYSSSASSDEEEEPKKRLKLT